MEQVERTRPQPVLLAQSLLASVQQEQDRSLLGQSTLDLDTLRSLDQLVFDIVRIVRGLINLQCPVSRLPAELLLEIFALVPRRCETRSGEGDKFGFESDKLWRVEDLCPLTAVCRQWRELALATPSLWSTLLSDESDSRIWPRKVVFHRHYIHRCPVGPVYVILRNVRKKSPVLESLEENRERVRELCAEGWYLDNGYQPLPHFPNLERCAWRGTHWHANIPDPSVLNFCDTPRLRTLELHFPPHIPLTSYPALTELTIIGPCPHSDFGDLLRLLSSTPQLRVLILGLLHGLRNIPGLSDRESDALNTHTGRPRVHLPLLQRLEIKPITPSRAMHMAQAVEWGPRPFRRALIRSLAFPLSCGVYLDPMSSEDLLPCARDLPHIRNATRLSMFSGLSSVSYQDTATLRFSTEDESLKVIVQLDLSPTRHGAEEWLSSLRDVLFTPHFPSIRKLSLGPSLQWICGPRPRSILATFPRLTLLRIAARTEHGESLEAISQSLDYQLAALQDDAQEADPNSDAGQPTCPLLTRLWLDWPRVLYTYQNGNMAHSEYEYDRPPSTIMDRLRDLARARAAQGHPLSRVFVTHPSSPSTFNDVDLDKLAYTVDEYDESVTRILSSRTLDPDRNNGAPLKELFLREWDWVEGAEP